jgi:hypothetical protein
VSSLDFVRIYIDVIIIPSTRIYRTFLSLVKLKQRKKRNGMSLEEERE